MPSVVFLTVDCLRSDHLGSYGYDRPTSPNIDELAENGTQFQHAYANCPGTLFAFQLLHCGIFSHRIDGLGIPDQLSPIAESFQHNGYATGGFAVNGYLSRDYGYDRGFDTYYSIHEANVKKHGMAYKVGKTVYDLVDIEAISEGILRPVYERLDEREQDSEGVFQPDHTDADTVAEAKKFIQSQERSDGDYFCWIHFMDAHTPYGEWPEHLQHVCGDADIEHTVHPGDEGLVSAGEHPPDQVINTYDACIRRVDQHIGDVLETVGEDTTIVLTGDHGETFGVYDDFHVPSLYTSKTQVPIIVRDPEQENGVTDTPAQHADIPPTLFHSAGLAIPDQFEGTPLQRVDRSREDSIYFSFYEDHAGIRTDQWKFILKDGETLLHEINSDGVEGPNVADSNSSVIVGFEDELMAFLDRGPRHTGKPAPSNDTEDISAEVEENLEDLGYL